MAEPSPSFNPNARARRLELKEVPDDDDLVDLIADMAPSEAERRARLVDNPQRLYGFTS